MKSRAAPHGKESSRRFGNPYINICLYIIYVYDYRSVCLSASHVISHSLIGSIIKIINNHYWHVSTVIRVICTHKKWLEDLEKASWVRRIPGHKLARLIFTDEWRNRKVVQLLKNANPVQRYWLASFSFVSSKKIKTHSLQLGSNNLLFTKKKRFKKKRKKKK